LADSYAEQIHASPVLSAAAQAVGLNNVSATQLASMVQARRLANTALIRLTVQHTDPTVAAQFANAIAQTFITQTAQDTASRASATQDNLAGLLSQLQTNEDARNHQIDNLRAQPASPERDSQIGRLSDQVAQLQASEGVAARSLQDLQLAAARGSS